MTTPPKQSIREVLRATALSTKQRCVSYSKGFGAMGALFAGSECVIEKARAKHDIYNAVYAGALREREERIILMFRVFSFARGFFSRFSLSPLLFLCSRSSSSPPFPPSHEIKTKNTNDDGDDGKIKLENRN